MSGSEGSTDNTSGRGTAGGVAASSGGPPPSPPVPHGPRLRVILTGGIVALLALAAGAHWSRQLGDLYSAAYASVHRGATSEPAGHQHGEAGAVRYYTCGMHPWVILPHPGDCPICHMKLVPLEAASFGGQVAVSPEISQSFGLRVAPVVTGPVTRVIRTVGTVDDDETLVRDVNLKIGGWVEKLYVDYTGQAVQAGQPLLDIYSPELYAAQEEYVQALNARAGQPRPAPGATTGETRWDGDLVEAARKRLEYFDISTQQIRELEQSGKAAKIMTIRAPYKGLVILKNVVQGAKVEAGTQLYRIADLSRVWVMVTLYEYQVPFVTVGQKADVSLPYIPGQTFQGKVGFIYPTLNQELRQAKVRVELDNPEMILKPGMFADVEIRSTLASDRVLVPRAAVTYTGKREVAFVSLGQGKFELRNVTLGVEADNGMVVVLDGLKPGDLVITSGEFLLDSEVNLREAQAKLLPGGLATQQKAPAAVAGASELASLPADAAAAVSALADNYFSIGDKLASDTMEGVGDAARKLAAVADGLVRIPIPQDEHFWHRHADEIAQIRGKALQIADAKDLARARELFADLGTSEAKLLRATGVPPSYGKAIEELHCPMYREGQGGTYWLQPAGPVRNPYYGKAMLECFDKRSALPVTGAKQTSTSPAQ
ncbi:MAG: efflux RND transporter periplasmic adaptor subunit [Phycisphaerae bacterium]